jgi:hypothetical protein
MDPIDVFCLVELHHFQESFRVKKAIVAEGPEESKMSSGPLH